MPLAPVLGHYRNRASPVSVDCGRVVQSSMACSCRDVQSLHHQSDNTCRKGNRKSVRECGAKHGEHKSENRFDATDLNDNLLL
jgi:hypothetical protein